MDMFVQRVNPQELATMQVGDKWNDKGLFVKDKTDIAIDIAPKYKNGNFKRTELVAYLKDGKVLAVR